MNAGSVLRMESGAEDGKLSHSEEVPAILYVCFAVDQRIRYFTCSSNVIARQRLCRGSASLAEPMPLQVKIMFPRADGQVRILVCFTSQGMG